MSRYTGWLIARTDGSIGFDAVPEREALAKTPPPCILAEHTIYASSLAVAFRRLADAVSDVPRPVQPCAGAL